MSEEWAAVLSAAFFYRAVVVMYMSFYFPFYDFREISPEGRKLYPPWPVPNVEEKSYFQKNLGSIRKRPRGGLRGWIQEREICEMARSIRIKADSNIQFRKRFYHDGTFSGYFSMGISGYFRGQSSKLSLASLTTMIESMLSLRVSSRHTSAQDSMHGYGRFALSLLGKSQPGPGAQNPDPWFGTKPPLVILEVPLIRLDRDVLSAARVRKLCSGSVIFFLDIPSIAGVPPFVILGQVSRNDDWNARRARMVLSRLYCELSMLSAAVDLLSSHQADEINHNLSSYFCGRLSDGLARVSGAKRISMLRDPNFYSEFRQIFLSAFDQSKIDAFAHGLEVHGARRNLREAFLRSQLLLQAANENQWEIIMGSKYVNYGTAFNMGDNAILGVDAVKLLAEFDQLKKELIQEGSTKSLIAAAAVSKAEENTKEGNESGVVEALKQGGNWALDVATSISVPLAIAAIKRATGL